MIVNQLNLQEFTNIVALKLKDLFDKSQCHVVVGSKLDDKYKLDKAFVVARLDQGILLTEEYADFIVNILVSGLNENEKYSPNHKSPLYIYVHGRDELVENENTTYISSIGANACISYIDISQRIVLRYSRLAERPSYKTNLELKTELKTLVDSYEKKSHKNPNWKPLKRSHNRTKITKKS